MAVGFVKRKISVTFTLAGRSFKGRSEDTVTLDGYRMSAHIVKAGGQAMGELQLRIFGMKLSLMNQLSTLGKTPVIIDQQNKVTVMAGDDRNGMGIVFAGTIAQAYTDLSGAPDAVFIVQAYAGLSEAMQAIPPSSYQGAADAAVIIAGLASQMSLPFENNGVSVMLSNSYFSGNARTQAYACAEAANINIIIDDGKIAIWPKGGSRSGTPPLISKDTGLVGYPFPSGQGLLGLRTLFNPQINYGGEIQVQSIIEPANGKWQVVNICHDIECEMPGGQWFSVIIGQPPGYLTLQH